MISSRRELFDEAIRHLTESFGPVDHVSEIMDFDLTDYYDEQMGTPLYRQFVSFSGAVEPDALVEAKHTTNRIETRLAERAGAPPRPINLDPGYLAASKLVLASMKDFSHRIYLGRGVYGDLTLIYRKGGWRKLAWTFPDYASGRYDSFLTEARSRIVGTGKEKNTK